MKPGEFSELLSAYAQTAGSDPSIARDLSTLATAFGAATGASVASLLKKLASAASHERFSGLASQLSGLETVLRAAKANKPADDVAALAAALTVTAAATLPELAEQLVARPTPKKRAAARKPAQKSDLTALVRGYADRLKASTDAPTEFNAALNDVAENKAMTKAALVALAVQVFGHPISDQVPRAKMLAELKRIYGLNALSASRASTIAAIAV